MSKHGYDEAEHESRESKKREKHARKIEEDEAKETSKHRTKGKRWDELSKSEVNSIVERMAIDGGYYVPPAEHARAKTRG